MRKRYGSFDPNIFRRWQEADKVEKLRNGLYLQKEEAHFAEVDLYLISYQLYGPSSISLHTALHYHGLIPE